MKRTAIQISLVAAAVTSTLLSGCASVSQTRATASAIRTTALNHLHPPVSRPVVAVHEGAWLMGAVVRPAKAPPPALTQSVTFERTDVSGLTLQDFAAWIVQHTGVAVTVDASARPGTKAGGAAQLPAASPGATAAPGPMDAPSGMPGAFPSFPGGQAALVASALGVRTAAGSRGDSAAPSAPTRLSYTGSLQGFLDVLAARFGMWWRYGLDGVHFFRTETKTWTLPELPKVASSTGGISTGGSMGGGAGGSTGGASPGGAPSTTTGASSSSGSGSTSMSGTLSVDDWSGLQKAAAAVAGTGATVNVDKSLGILTVTATPPQLERVSGWAKSLTADMQKQVVVDVHVYNVQTTHEDNYGVGLNLAYKNASGHTGISVTGAQAPSVVGGQTPFSFGANILSGPLTGSSLAVQALSTLGDVSQVVSRSGVTSNGQMLALQAAKQVNYLAGSTSLLTSTSGSSTTLQSGTVTVGFTASFLPKVVNSRILLDVNMTLSDLLGIQTIASGGSSLQLPSIAQTTFQQVVSLKSGQTLVLTGYRQRGASVTNNGVGSPDMPLLGGGVDASNSDSILAVVISARLL
ncbi:pilus assembly protein PilN [Thiomonas sp.]|uniref:pilus assembly protein PilN n=1 Tax=Thiomonas sp. TaxID=2047785 RepID=UPI00261B1A23|nr:pilus assembly protein PilN [Thiomonas sp.]